MISFDELMRKFYLIKDLILTKMEQDYINESLDFSKHLYETKCWFIRISWKNKKRFLLDLIDEVQDLWTLSLLLKSIWNCRPKDAILSISENKSWSGYDRVPMDHNRTVLSSAVQDIIISDRKWFHSLDSEQKCLALGELLSIAGGPIMWEVLMYSQKIYEQIQEQKLENLKECVVINEPPTDKKLLNAEIIKKEQTPRRKSSATQILGSSTQHLITAQVQKELETNLAIWCSTIKAIKDNLKLEEIEMTFNDGTKKKIWRVNRSKPEAVETVDFIQLLPSSIGKRILWHLPLTQLSDCARVNRYWAYLVDELRAELTARQKIDIELEKLQENMLRHDVSLGLLNKLDTTLDKNAATAKTRKQVVNESRAYSLRLEMNKEKKQRVANPPFRNMADLNARLDIRGAADGNIRKWCTNICKISKNRRGEEAQTIEVFKKQENFIFPSPILSVGVNIPLNPALVEDPTKKTPLSMVPRTVAPSSYSRPWT